MSLFAESTVEEAELQWFGEVDFTTKHGPHIAPVVARGAYQLRRDVSGETKGRLVECIEAEHTRQTTQE